MNRTIENARQLMALAPDLERLRDVWVRFPPHVREHPDMIEFKDKLKEQMK